MRKPAPKSAPKSRSRARARPRRYLHGYTAGEEDRLRFQAAFLADAVHDRLPFRRCRALLEVGCGVGAQTEILLRHFPLLHVTGVDRDAHNLTRAKAHLAKLAF